MRSGTAFPNPVILCSAILLIAAPLAAKSGKDAPKLPTASFVTLEDKPSETYVIGPLDTLTVFVWRNPELGGKVQVRPDGRITTPLIEDMQAVGKTPKMLADDITEALSKYVTAPRVSVIVENFSGTFSQQVRIVGATDKPAAIPYRANMTLLDAMIAVGGLSEYAAGNRARLVRYDRATGKQVEFPLRIASLLKKGDIKANVGLEPGDVIIIPESMF
jgi:polysaccharide export outer membrane protein